MCIRSAKRQRPLICLFPRFLITNESIRPNNNSGNMSNPSKQDAQVPAVKKEVCTKNEEIPRAQLVSNSKAAEAEEDGIYHLSGKPFFDVILSKPHLAPQYQLKMPRSMLQFLPRATVPVVLRYGGKNWKLSCNGDARNPKFDNNWRMFVIKNHLESGDACVFELMENSSTVLKFKVHILRKRLPPELLAEIDSRGRTPETPIEID